MQADLHNQNLRRVILLTQMFPPELGAAANRLSALTQAFSRLGWDARVITLQPTYMHNKNRFEYKRLFSIETNFGASIYRVLPIFAGKRNLVLRSLLELWLCGWSVLLGLFMPRPHLVYATSPSIFLAFAGVILTILKRSVFVWEVRDLTWRYAQELGKIQSSRVISVIEGWLMRVAHRADQIIVTNKAQAQFLARKGLDIEKILVVPNGLDEDFEGLVFSSRPGNGPKLRVMYGGLIGYPQGLGILLDVAEAYITDPDIEFVLLGDGSEKVHLVKEARRRSLVNVTFLPPVPRHDYLALCAGADILFVHLRDGEAFAAALPSKIFEYMAVARPIIFAGRGAGAEIIIEAQAGLVVPPENAAAIKDAIEKLRRNPAITETMGTNGREYVYRFYNRNEIFNRLVMHFSPYC